MIDPKQESRLLSLSTVLGPDTLVIEEVSGLDELSQPFELKVTASAKDDRFKIEDLIGTKISIRVQTAAEGGDDRHLCGFVAGVDHMGFDVQDLSRYELTVVPWLWMLTKTSDCRIFQEITVPEIIRKVFADFNHADFRVELKGNYPQREYCVQYRETDFNFVQRLMEHEGIYYFWEHKDNAHTMVICDHMSSHKPVPGFGSIRYRSEFSGVQDKFYLWTWEAKHRVTSGKYALNSFDFKNPKPSANSRLLSRSDKTHSFSEGEHEIYDNPGDFINRSDGERLATIRREENQCSTNTIKTKTNARGLFTGALFSSTDLPRNDQNAEYLITSSRFIIRAGNYSSGTNNHGATYECEMTGIPSNGVFRPERSARQPKVEGPQTAIVSGPAGEEIHVDPYGRVKVQFLWDREGEFDAGSSCWIRVSQAWAGGSFGAMSIPRIGHEVIVDFLEGDPDRPIITGRVYNGSNMPHSSNSGRDDEPGNKPPQNLPEAKMMTSFKSNSLGGSGGSNEITMNDKGGEEVLFFKAQKNEISRVGNDRDDKVTNNEKLEVCVNRERKVGGKETVEVTGKRKMTMKADHEEDVIALKKVTVGAGYQLGITGEYKTTVTGGHKTTVTGDKTTSVTGSISKTATAAYSITATGGITITSMSSISLVVGGSSIVISPSGINIVSSAPVTVTGAIVQVNG